MSLLAAYAVVTSDKHGTILSANQSAVKMFGYAQQELIGAKITILMSAPFCDQHESFLLRYQKHGEVSIPSDSRAMTGLNKQGENISLTMAISESHTARGSLFIALFEKAPDRRVIIDTDQTGKIFGVKGNVFLTFGYHKDGLIGANISILTPANVAASHQEFMMNCDPTNSSLVGKLRNLQAMHRTNPEPINISLLVKQAFLHVKKDDGTVEEIPGYRGIITPVDNMEAIVSLSKMGEILSASPEFFLLFGYSKEEITGHSITRLMKGDPKEIFSFKKSGSRKKIECIHKDRSIFTAEINVQKAANHGEDEIFVCRIGRASSKKEDKDIISEGEQMGLYTYGKILGSGYFGKVRMAYHRITNGKVAIKTLRKKQYLSVNMEYPPREIAVLKAVDHPHVNRLYDTVVLSDRIHLILEFVEGRELCEIVETNPVPEEVCRHLWRQILTGIDHLHKNGIVHRDLKLENIIIDRQGNAKIIDLGFGNFVLHENHLLRTFCGSPDYAAPELFLGNAYNGFHADCWSLGVLLFALLSGLLPFKDSHCVTRGTYQFPPSITPKARDLISKILTKDPTVRLTVDQMLEHPWTCIGYPGPPPQPRPLLSSIDQEILEEMVPLGMDVGTVRKSLETKEFNQFTTSYFLLLKEKNKLLQQGGNKPQRVHRKRTGDDCVLL